MSTPYAVTCGGRVIGHAYDIDEALRRGVRIGVHEPIPPGMVIEVRCPEDEEFVFTDELSMHRELRVLRQDVPGVTYAPAGVVNLSVDRAALQLRLYRRSSEAITLLVLDDGFVEEIRTEHYDRLPAGDTTLPDVPTPTSRRHMIDAVTERVLRGRDPVGPPRARPRRS